MFGPRAAQKPRRPSPTAAFPIAARVSTSVPTASVVRTISTSAHDTSFSPEPEGQTVAATAEQTRGSRPRNGHPIIGIDPWPNGWELQGRYLSRHQTTASGCRSGGSHNMARSRQVGRHIDADAISTREVPLKRTAPLSQVCQSLWREGWKRYALRERRVNEQPARRPIQRPGNNQTIFCETAHGGKQISLRREESGVRGTKGSGGLRNEPLRLNASQHDTFLCGSFGLFRLQLTSPRL
jgi:hypothetical protein